MTVGASRTETLLAATAEELGRAASVRFTREVENGELDHQVFANYLQIEADFVTVASRLHGMAVWDAPDAAAIDRHADALRHLITDQVAYFAAALRDWPAQARWSEAGTRMAGRLSTTTRWIARQGGYAGVVTALFAAETLYATWCARAASSPRLPEDAIGEWVRLHTGPDFLRGVDDLTSAVDGLTGPDAPDDPQLATWFTAVLAAEVDFHAAPYEVT